MIRYVVERGCAGAGALTGIRSRGTSRRVTAALDIPGESTRRMERARKWLKVM